MFFFISPILQDYAFQFDAILVENIIMRQNMIGKKKPKVALGTNAVFVLLKYSRTCI